MSPISSKYRFLSLELPFKIKIFFLLDRLRAEYYYLLSLISIFSRSCFNSRSILFLLIKL